MVTLPTEMAGGKDFVTRGSHCERRREANFLIVQDEQTIPAVHGLICKKISDLLVLLYICHYF